MVCLYLLYVRNLDKKGGAFVIMNHQFRRASGVTIVRDMANHKLSRLHYVRATAEDGLLLRNTAEANHSDNRRWNYGNGRRSGWYSKHTLAGRICMQIMNTERTSLVRFRSVPSVVSLC